MELTSTTICAEMSRVHPNKTSHTLPSLLTREPKLPPNQYRIVSMLGHALLPHLRDRRHRFRRTRAHAHLATSVHHRCARAAAANRVLRVLGAVESAADKPFVMSVGCSCVFAHDAGPDGAEGEEDAYDSQNEVPELWDLGVELEASENG